MKRLYKGYVVHSDGRIEKKSGKGFMKPYLRNTGYHHFNVNRKDTLWHRFVWEAFNGKIPDDMEIDHIDSNKLNNNIDNLQLMSRSANASKGNVKYTRKDIQDVNYLRSIGMTYSQIGKEMGMHPSTVGRIITKKYYYTR